MHIWKAETAAEKKKAKEEIDCLNKILEPQARQRWELETAMRCFNLRGRPPGRLPQWKFTLQTGKVECGSEKGIFWYRYQKVILKGKLLPFAQECKKS